MSTTVTNSTKEPNVEEHRSILIEIVSAFQLSPSTSNSDTGDPFCTIRFAKAPTNDKHVLHETEVIRNNLNPIWTILTKSLFLLETTEQELEERGGLVFELLDMEGVLFHSSSYYSHGCVRIPADVLLNGKGDRIEFLLKKTEKGDGSSAKQNHHVDVAKEGKPNKQGILALRFKDASEADRAYMNESSETGTHIQEDKEKENIPTSFDFKQQKVDLTHRFQNLFRPTSKSGEEMIRVSMPDPNNPKETTWMTARDIEKTSLMPSQKWVEAGSGDFGTAYVEVIACENLPNLDVGVGTNLSDPFVALLFEDALVRTDVFFDTLNPRWMPWNQRAFAFPIQHPTSILSVGVFDYDVGLISNHDSIGRVVIDLANVKNDTVYLLRYTLHQDPNQEDDCGTILLRLRLEWNDEKEALVQSFGQPPRYHVNVDSSKAHDVLHYLCKGKVNMSKPSMKTVSLLAGELSSYSVAFVYLFDSMIKTLLWRGRLTLASSVKKIKDANSKKKYVHVSELTVWFPIHSFVLFQGAVMAIEHPRFIPSLLCFSVAWMVGTIMAEKQSYPSPWKRCKSAADFILVLLDRGYARKKLVINDFEGEEESKMVDAIDQAMRDQFFGYVNAFSEASQKFQKDFGVTDMEELAIETEDNDFAFFGSQLSSIHSLLLLLCTNLRQIRNIVTWKSSSYSFVILSVFTVAGIVSLLIPWSFLFLWTARIVVWTILGPWMKLVDIFVVNDNYKSRDDLIEEQNVEGMKIEFTGAKYENLARLVRVAAEDSIKLKDMREHRFGKYISMVPPNDESRFPNIPQPQSSARPYKADQQEEGYQYLPNDEVQWIHCSGQRLYGRMVHSLCPTRSYAVESDANGFE